MSSEQIQIDPGAESTSTDQVPTWRRLGSESIASIRSLNPMRRVGDYLDDGGEYMIVAVIVGAALSLIIPEAVSDPVLGAYMLMSVDGIASFSSAREDAKEVDDARDLYLEGVISLEEFEERLDLLLDEERQQLRERVEQINGIGPDRSSRIVSEFADGSELRDATTDELTEIHGIGESMAVEIVSEVGR